MLGRLTQREVTSGSVLRRAPSCLPRRVPTGTPAPPGLAHGLGPWAGGQWVEGPQAHLSPSLNPTPVGQRLTLGGAPEWASVFKDEGDPARRARASGYTEVSKAWTLSGPDPCGAPRRDHPAARGQAGDAWMHWEHVNQRERHVQRPRGRLRGAGVGAGLGGRGCKLHPVLRPSPWVRVSV